MKQNPVLILFTVLRKQSCPAWIIFHFQYEKCAILSKTFITCLHDFFFFLREDKEQNSLVLLIYRILLNCSLKFLLDLPTPVLSTQLLGISSRGTLQAGVNALRARVSRESIQEGHEERWCSKHAPLWVTPGWPAVMTPCGGCREEKEGERYLPLKCPAHGSSAVQSRNVEQMDSYSYQGRPLELLVWPLRVRVFSNYVKYLCISGLTIHF